MYWFRRSQPVKSLFKKIVKHLSAPASHHQPDRVVFRTLFKMRAAHVCWTNLIIPVCSGPLLKLLPWVYGHQITQKSVQCSHMLLQPYITQGPTHPPRQEQCSSTCKSKVTLLHYLYKDFWYARLIFSGFSRSNVHNKNNETNRNPDHRMVFRWQIISKVGLFVFCRHIRLATFKLFTTWNSPWTWGNLPSFHPHTSRMAPP